MELDISYDLDRIERIYSTLYWVAIPLPAQKNIAAQSEIILFNYIIAKIEILYLSATSI